MAQQHDNLPARDSAPDGNADVSEGSAQAAPIDITATTAVDPDARSDEADDTGLLGWSESTDEPSSEADKKRRALIRKVVLGALAVVGLAGTVFVGTAAARIVREKDTTLTPPDSVAGLRRDGGASAVQAADDLRTALAAGIDLDDTVAVVYTDPANAERNVFLFGGTALLFTPEQDLDEVLRLLGEQADGDGAMREFPAGDLGGVMKCGTVTSVPGGGMSACGWADHGSVAIAMFPERNLPDAAALMRQLREATQQRS